MLARMAISRIVTAPDVSASPAQAKMHPSVAHGEAFLTTIAAWVHRPYRIEVGTMLPSFSHWYSVGIRIDAGASHIANFAGELRSKLPAPHQEVIPFPCIREAARLF
jgi:hypothetical protein